MIPIQNIYYMLSYAFRALRGNGYRRMAAESFHNSAELCAAILCRGVSAQLKRGFQREYIPFTESLTAVRGKIDITGSLKSNSMLRRQLVCDFNEYSINTYKNRILKSTLELLLRADISKQRKHEIRNLLMYFGDVDTIDMHSVNWHLQYYRNDEEYQMLISICYLVVNGLLHSASSGSLKLAEFDEPHMARLYEKFILEYYRTEHPELKAASSQIEWALDAPNAHLLPQMQSDIMLSRGARTLIIDAKFYNQIMSPSPYSASTLRSGHLYQMFAYVKNHAAQGGDVSGLLLYAKTDEQPSIDEAFNMSGNLICAKTLDMNCGFTEISAQLDEIVKKFFM